MKEQYYNELGNIQIAFKTLRQYNQYALFPVTESLFDNPILLEYFDSPLDAPIERKVEKILCAAAARAIYENKNISSKRKEACAKRAARDMRETLKLGKLEYHASEKELFVSDYRRRKRSLHIIKYAARINKAKKILKNCTLNGLIRTIAGPVTYFANYGARLVWNILPDKVRKPIVAAAKDLKEKAINTIETCCTYIKNTAVGKAVTKAIEKCKPFYQKFKEKAVKIKNKITDKLKSLFA